MECKISHFETGVMVHTCHQHLGGWSSKIMSPRQAWATKQRTVSKSTVRAGEIPQSGKCVWTWVQTSACTSKSSAWKYKSEVPTLETGGVLGLAGQPTWTNQWAPGQWQILSCLKKQGVWHLRNSSQGCPLVSIFTHPRMCTHTRTVNSPAMSSKYRVLNNYHLYLAPKHLYNPKYNPVAGKPVVGRSLTSSWFTIGLIVF